ETLDEGERVLAAAQPNFGRHVFIETADDVYARIPLRSRLLKPGDDIAAAVVACLAALARSGLSLTDGDLILVSEKALAISQGRSYPVADIHPTRLASFLCRFVSRKPTGLGPPPP